MDDFTRYERLRAIGLSPARVYATAKASGVDEITAIRLLRQVFSLSLADAKRAIDGGAWFEARQVVEVGSRVSWNDTSSIEGPFLLDARVEAIHGSRVALEDLQKFQWVAGELIATPLDGTEPRELSIRELERPLFERFQVWESRLADLSEVSR